MQTVVATEQKNVLMKTEQVCKTYKMGNEEFHAAKQIDLEIYEGDFTVIMGSSGSGKSTLLYLLSGMDQVTSGHVSFRGQRIDRFSEQEMAQFRSKQIGFVYQAINLVPDLTLLENVSFPAYVDGTRGKGAIKEQALSLLKQMGIEAQSNRLPSQVSGGQQQRAAIARSLINGPELLFADEPTGALSHEHGIGILDILSESNRQGQSIVMVTHDYKAASRADRLIMVKDGVISEEFRFAKYRPEDAQEREAAILSYLSKKEAW